VTKERLLAFSDGVIAIIITIMVLELKAPHGTSLAALRPLTPVFLSYVLSFIYVGIYWNNHHHMFQIVHGVSGGVLWANLHLLFWLSLVPFVTAWIGENHISAVPVALYGLILFMCAVAYTILSYTIIANEGPGSKLAAAMGKDRKGKISLALYVAGIAVAGLSCVAAMTLYVAVAVIWLVPDRRMEKALAT
jgi:uncharacterized membrane protein